MIRHVDRTRVVQFGSQKSYGNQKQFEKDLYMAEQIDKKIDS